MNKTEKDTLKIVCSWISKHMPNYIKYTADNGVSYLVYKDNFIQTFKKSITRELEKID